MAENCAGCGHSHDLSGGRFGPTLACWEPPFGSCKCPGYRTRGQLDALARIEELEEVAEAARAQRKREHILLEEVPVSAHGEAECDAMTRWIDAGAGLESALAALGGEE